VLHHLNEIKGPYLFSSDGLALLLETTTSIRTKIAIIQMVGPRLIDPKAKISYFTGLFRYTEEKSIVEEVLKARAQVLATSMFSRKEGIKSFAGRGPGRGNPLAAGRGGMGGATKSANWHPVQKPNNYGTRNVMQTPSDDSLEGAVPTVFGFEAVLNTLDDPFHPPKITKTVSSSLEAIPENRLVEVEEEDDDENEALHEHDFAAHYGKESAAEEGHRLHGEEHVETGYVEELGEDHEC
jgi:hypothetical protein